LRNLYVGYPSNLTSIRYAGSIILKAVYGYDTLEDGDPIIATANRFLSKMGEITEPGYLVELLPWRAYHYLQIAATLEIEIGS